MSLPLDFGNFEKGRPSLPPPAVRPIGGKCGATLVWLQPFIGLIAFSTSTRSQEREAGPTNLHVAGRERMRRLRVLNRAVYDMRARSSALGR